MKNDPQTIEKCVKCKINCVLGDIEPDFPNGCSPCMETPVLSHGEIYGSHNYLEEGTYAHIDRN